MTTLWFLSNRVSSILFNRFRPFNSSKGGRRLYGWKGLLPRVRTHHCEPDSLGLTPEKDGQVSAAFAIFVVHEVPDPAKLFREIAALLVPGGTFYYTEPPFIVSGGEFRENLAAAEAAGFRVTGREWYFVNRAAVLVKE